MKISVNAMMACLIISSSFSGFGYAQEQTKLLAAPDIVPPATEAMQHPEFWISRIEGNPDRVIMTPGQIRELNRKNRTRRLVGKDVTGDVVSYDEVLKKANFSGIFFHLEDPLAIRSIPGDSLRMWFGVLRDYVSTSEWWDRRHLPYPEETKRRLIDSTNEDTIPGQIQPRYGIAVAHTLQRVMPTHDMVYRTQYHWLDMFVKAVIETGMPVAILHMTDDGSWYYVKSEYSLGWVPAKNIAEGSVREIRRLAEPDDFIVACTHKVPVYADSAGKTWITDIYMGARLPLVSTAADGYRVLVPFRDADGSLRAVNGWVKPDADVHVGFQPYTQRNVITTIFKLLNRPYGWGGTDNERDCVGTIRAVYKTFGLFMPRWTTYILYSTDHVTILPRDMPLEEKYRYLDVCEPGITVCGFDWHVVLYLGKVDGIHYVIHQNGFSYHDEEGNEFRVGRVSVNHTELEGGADIALYTELSVFKP